MKKIIVGISAADGVQIGVRLLKLLREMPEVETHLVLSRNTDTNLRLELGMILESCSSSSAQSSYEMTSLIYLLWNPNFPRSERMFPMRKRLRTKPTVDDSAMIPVLTRTPVK